MEQSPVRPQRRPSLIATSRSELVRQVGTYLDTDYYPRTGALVIVSTAASAGFLVSAALLDAGWYGMPSRYAVAAFAAYLLFILLVRLWAAYYRYLHPEPVDAIDLATQVLDSTGRVGVGFGGSGEFSGGGAGRTLDLPDAATTPVEAADPIDGATSLADSAGALADLDEGALWLAPFLFAAALIAGLVGAMLVIAGAPALLGEVLLDAGIAGLIYRRIYKYPTQHWLHGVVLRTWKPMLTITVVLVAIAAIAQQLRLAADSIGDFFR
jgi:hypothetical protein